MELQTQGWAKLMQNTILHWVKQVKSSSLGLGGGVEIKVSWEPSSPLGNAGLDYQQRQGTAEE